MESMRWYAKKPYGVAARAACAFQPAMSSADFVHVGIATFTAVRTLNGIKRPVGTAGGSFG